MATEENPHTLSHYEPNFPVKRSRAREWTTLHATEADIKEQILVKLQAYLSKCISYE